MRMLFSIALLLISYSALSVEKKEPYAVGAHLEYTGDVTKPGYKICLTGDSGSIGPKIYMVARGMADEGCDQIRHMGDIVYSSGIKSKHSLKSYLAFRWPYSRIFKKNKDAVMFMSVGNHDYKKNPYAWIDLAGAHDNVVMPSLYYTDFWDDVCFFTLDTMDIGEKQTTWLQRRFEESRERCSMTFVYGHHPYITSGRSAAGGAYKTWLEDNIVGKVDFFMAGHDHHVADEGNVDGTQFLLSGAGGHGLRPVSNTRPDGYAIEDFGYIVIELTRLEDGRLKADYKVVTVKRNREWYQVFKKGGIVRKVRHVGSLVGKGIR